MKNPLIKRLPRELKSEAGKYIVIFLFMVIVIGFVSGMTVASGGIMKIYNESFEKYNIEDGNFEALYEISAEVTESLEEEGITLYKNFYVERETDHVNSTLRIFKIREEVNKVCVMEGKLPETDVEIAIDRMYANNNGLKVGDTLSVGGKALTVTGLVALSDYSALYASPSDMMFDAIQFGVSVMTEDGFETMGNTGFHYSYSWVYDEAPANDKQAKERAEELVEVLAEKVLLTNYIPMYANQAIQFVGDDTGKDRMMFIVFLYIVVIIIAFITAITTNNTIAKEANVIGTLRASGYTRGELVRHYLTMPMLVIAVSAIVGNILGYTVFEAFAVDIYYTNYSLPTYVTIWSADAFVKTTVVPVILMLVINWWILTDKLRMSPLKFIRRDLSKKQKKKAFRLNTKIPIMHRFRMRIIFQNIPNYITIVVGIFLANIIMLLGMGFPRLLDNNEKLISENMISNYQYILKAPVETAEETAEAYCAGNLATIPDRLESETVTVYGISEDSVYFNMDIVENGVCISKAYSEKYKVKTGDVIRLKEEFGTREYEFQVTGIYGNPTTITVYMDRDYFNNTFEYEEGYYNGYLCEEEIEDIDDLFIATKITEDDMNKMSRQLNRSMGEIMDMFFWFGILMFMLIIYLLSKIVIEKNTQSISMTKILGYTNGEISGLYILSTGIVVVLSFLLTMPIVNEVMRLVCEVMFSTFPGWMPYEVPASVYYTIILIGIGAYAIIAFLQFARIRKIPMDTALKNVE